MSSRYSSRLPQKIRIGGRDGGVYTIPRTNQIAAAQGKLKAEYASKKAQYNLLGVELPNEPAAFTAPTKPLYSNEDNLSRGQERARRHSAKVYKVAALQRINAAEAKISTEKAVRDSGVGNATLDEDAAFRKKLLRKALKRGLPSVQTDKTALA